MATEFPPAGPEFPATVTSSSLVEEIHRFFKAIDAEIFGRLTARSGAITGDFDVSGDLSVTGDVTMGGDLTMDGDIVLDSGTVKTADVPPYIQLYGAANPTLRFYVDTSHSDYGLIQAGEGIPDQYFLVMAPPYGDEQHGQVTLKGSAGGSGGSGVVLSVGESYAAVTDELDDVVLIDGQSNVDPAGDVDVLRVTGADVGGDAFRVHNDGTVYDQNDDEIWGTRVIYRFGPSTAMTVNNTNKTVLFDSQAVADTGLSYSAGDWTVTDAGLYEIDVRVTVETIDDTAGIRGEPEISLWTRPDAGSYSAINPKAKDYTREDATDTLSAHLTIHRIISLSALDGIKVTVTDNVTTEPNEQVAANMCSMSIKKLR